jgi:hypothetical protein
MKKSIYIFGLAISILFFACSPKYFANGVISAGYDKAKTYKTIILPPVTDNLDETGNNALSETTYKDINLELGKNSSFSMTGDYRSVRIKANAYKYGSLNTMDASLAQKVAKEMKADAFVISKISREQTDYPIRVNIEIYDSNATMMYSGQGRAANPSSAEAEIELAVQFALQQLNKK